MFRSLFRSLIVSRPKARTPVQTFRPQLETLESRLAPSSYGGHHSSPSIDVDISHSVIVLTYQSNEVSAYPGAHVSINQEVNVFSGNGSSHHGH